MAAKYKCVFVDIDTQFDFIDAAGALPVPQALQIIPNLERLFAVAVEHNIPVISSADNHVPDDPEFAEFPPHCVRGTTGQHKISQTLLGNRATIEPDEQVDDLPQLLDQHQQLIFNKSTLEIWDNPNACRLVERVDAEAWYVFGVATDYCVKIAALGLAEAGKPTWLVSDAIKGLTPEGEEQTLAVLQAKGAKLIATDELIDALARQRTTKTG